MSEKPQNVQEHELQKFGFLVGGVLIVIWGYVHPLKYHSVPSWPSALGVVLALIGWIAPKALKPLYSVWMRLGKILGDLNSRVILGILFFAVVLPIGRIMRLLGKPPMSQSFSSNNQSYRVVRQDTDTFVSRMEDPF